MFDWQWPWMGLLLPLPFLARWLLSSIDQANDAIRVPFYHDLLQLEQQQAHTTSFNWLPAMAAFLVWLCLIAASARPTWIGEPISVPQDKRDLLLAVDISKSMQQDDMLESNRYIERITAVKAVVGDFIKQRSGDRIGLILFGEQAYLQTPLTFDNRTVKQQLAEAQLGFAGNATAIGDAIGLAIKKLRGRPAESRVLVLLTDGANTAGTDPRQAAEVAAEAKIRIHTVGVGADSKLVRGIFGGTKRVNPGADLDEEMLTDIADQTAGKYFRARDPNELQQIYAEIDRLEPMPEDQTFRPTRSLTHWPLGIAIGLSALLALVRLVKSWYNRRSVKTLSQTAKTTGAQSNRRLGA